MVNRSISVAIALLLGMAALTNTGCVGITSGLDYGFVGVPIPVSTYFQDQAEDKHWEHERYERSAILGPLTAGSPDVALDPPSDDQVMRMFEKSHPVEGGLPLMHEVQINNVRIVKEKVADYIDPPRVYPMVGPAQLHHAHYKCTVYFTEVTRVGWPVPHTLLDEDGAEVIYIDKNHLHMVGNIDAGAGSNY